MGTGAQGGYYAVTTWLPTFLRTERKLSVLDSAGYLAVSIFGAFAAISREASWRTGSDGGSHSWSLPSAPARLR